MNKGASPVVQTITSSLPPGVIHGYMGRPTGLPTIGAAVVSCRTTDLLYCEFNCFNRWPILLYVTTRKYVVLIAYPDGTNKKVTDFQVEQGTAYSLDFRY